MNPVDRVRKAFAGRYRIERELGADGMVTIYVARDLRHDSTEFADLHDQS